MINFHLVFSGLLEVVTCIKYTLKIKGETAFPSSLFYFNLISKPTFKKRCNAESANIDIYVYVIAYNQQQNQKQISVYDSFFTVDKRHVKRLQIQYLFFLKFNHEL